MSKAKAILKDLRNLDLYIASLIRRRDKVEASLLSSQKYSVDKVSGGIKKKQDDIYVELLTAKDEIEQKLFNKVDQLYKELLYLQEKYQLKELEIYTTPPLVYKIF